MRLKDLKDQLKKAAAMIEVQNDVILNQDNKLEDYDILITKLLTHDNNLGEIIDNHYKCEECSL